MMKIKKIFMASLLVLSSISASAQDQKDVRVEHIFHPHWYVTVQPLGGQYTIGEVDFDKLLSYNVQAALGYEFSPYIGARLSVNAWTSKAGTEETYFTNGSIMDPRMEWKWKYVAPSVDVTFNLSNMIMGNFNPKRPFILSGFVGLGANIAWGNDEANEHYNNMMNLQAAGQRVYVDEFAPFRYLWDGTKTRLNVRFGLTGDIRLSDRLSLNLEAQANTLSDRYNSKKAENADWYFNALAGLKINLGKTHHTNIIAPPEPEIRYVEKVVEKVVEKQIPCPEAKVETIEPLRRDIFFTISSVRIDASERQKVEDIVNYLKKYPNAKVTVTGYADKGTGNAKINERLGNNRAKTVTDELVNKYGIDRSRIVSSSKGDTEQPYAENEKNRVSICIAE